jgi:prepilin-type N-terminal cleavage/methylation domain-containing protein
MVDRTQNTKKGFTLLEVLIASSMFAVVMLMTTATIAGSSSFQSKLKAMRETSEETRRLADMITRDVRSASQPTSYTLGTDFNFKNGLAFLKWSGGWQSIYKDAPSGPATNDANVLIVASKDNFIVYGSGQNSSGQNVLCYGKISYSDLALYAGGAGKNAFISNVGGCYYSASSHPEFVISNTDVTVNFGGYLPDDNVAANFFQPYVQFIVTARTNNYAKLDNNSRAQAVIRSTVTSRSYNN